MRWQHCGLTAVVAMGLALAVQADQGRGGAPAEHQVRVAVVRAAAGRGGATGAPIGGTLTPAPVDARGWGWQVKASMNPATPRPLYNKAKELLLQDKQITSYTIATYNPDLYCEVGKHFDYVWFEMQHSTMSYDEVRRMLLACPGVGAAPMIRMPDALESSIQRATDLGSIGIIVPTVDDALEARDAARFSRYPPFGRRSSGGGSFGQVWPGVNYRATVNDNMLVTVMIETLEGVANAEEIAATHGVDVVLIGNNDLSSFSGWGQNDLALPGRADQGPRRGAEIRQVLRQRRRAVSEWLRPQRRHAHGAEWARARRVDALRAAVGRRRGPRDGAGSARPR